MPRKPRELKDRSKLKEPSAQDFEKLGTFYLGRRYDVPTKQLLPELLLYDSKDLVTHAVCIGMTGSGKTGLCIGLLEEAAIDGIPSLIVDPKGDLTNLMLTFPELRASDFAPWVNEDDARKKRLSTDDYAAEQARLWTEGLASWGQDGTRIRKLRETVDCLIYTPGSHAGIPLSILKSFAAPPKPVLDDPETCKERINATVTGLLALIGLDADPIKSREHILLSTIFDHQWKGGTDLTLASLIHALQSPPIAKIGVMDLESFFPSKERFALAMRLNNLLAAPGFSTWLEGDALDVAALLHSPSGKPRMCIVSIAHLNDAERMFFVTLLLTQVVGWMRMQSGTTSLRAILYMDELFGYFPPVANPPSKAPLLTLLKQARAFGLGVVMATQNPVDLDYKGLANTGTWFIGRLQTERDKARVMEGLEGAAASGGKQFDRSRMEQLLAGLGSRIFLMNNVHEDAPELFQTRWTLSYLRGPLTRAQIKRLMEPIKQHATDVRRRQASEDHPPSVGTGMHDLPALLASGSRPVLPPDVPQYFLPVRGTQPSGAQLIYRPMLLGFAHVRFTHAKAGIDQTELVTIMAPIIDGPMPLAWDQAADAAIEIADLNDEPEGPAAFAPLPASAAKGKSYERWKQDFSGWLFRTRKIDVMRSPGTNTISRPGESERDFRARLQQSSREQRDQAAERLRLKYAPKIAVLQERIRRARQVVERQTAESRNSQLQAAISVGATILGAFLGRKTVSATNIGKATTAIRSAGRVMKETTDVGQAQENVAALEQQLADLEQQFRQEVEKTGSATDSLTESFETVSITPTKTNIAVKLVALTWMPQWQATDGALTPAWR